MSNLIHGSVNQISGRNGSTYACTFTRPSFLNIQTQNFRLTDRLILDKIESLLRRFHENGLLKIDGANQFIEVEVGIKTYPYS